MRTPIAPQAVVAVAQATQEERGGLDFCVGRIKFHLRLQFHARMTFFVFTGPEYCILPWKAFLPFRYGAASHPVK